MHPLVYIHILDFAPTCCNIPLLWNSLQWPRCQRCARRKSRYFFPSNCQRSWFGLQTSQGTAARWGLWGWTTVFVYAEVLDTRVSRKRYYAHLDYGCLQRLHVVCIVCMFYMLLYKHVIVDMIFAWFSAYHINRPLRCVKRVDLMASRGWKQFSWRDELINPQCESTSSLATEIWPKITKNGWFFSGFDFQGLTKRTWLHNCL